MNLVFAHNVHTRFQTLYDTIKIEKELFPESRSIVGYNADSPADVLDEFKNIDYVKFQGLTHKIGCTNGCIATIKEALNKDADVIVFSHDDVMIDVMHHATVLKNVEDIYTGKYDAICRRPMPMDIHGHEYYMMEVFFISKKMGELAFKNKGLFMTELSIPKDARDSISPEVFLHQTLNAPKGLKIYEHCYFHTIDNYNETLAEHFGFHHKNVGFRGWTD